MGNILCRWRARSSEPGKKSFRQGTIPSSEDDVQSSPLHETQILEKSRPGDTCCWRYLHRKMAESSEPGKKITGEAEREIIVGSEDLTLISSSPLDETQIIGEEPGDSFNLSRAALGSVNLGPVESEQHIEGSSHSTACVEAEGAKIDRTPTINYNYGDSHCDKRQTRTAQFMAESGAVININQYGVSNIQNAGTSRAGAAEDEQKSTKRTDIPEGCAKICEDTYMFVNKPIKKGFDVFKGFIVHVGGRKKPVAIKRITPFDEKSEREAALLLNLSPHPNVVEIFRSKVHQGLTQKELYIVMELCMERNLQDYLDENRGKRKPLKEAVSFTKQLIEALKHIHGNNIIHGDLKPQNILFSLDGKQILKISDFGISKKLKERSTTKFTGFGSDGYRAPETYSRDSISKGADIYSFGIIVFALFADGRHPYGDDLHECIVRMKKGKHPDLSSLSWPVRRVLSALLMKIFQLKPKKRPTIEEIASSPPDLDSLVQVVQDPYQVVIVGSPATIGIHRSGP